MSSVSSVRFHYSKMRLSHTFGQHMPPWVQEPLICIPAVSALDLIAAVIA